MWANQGNKFPDFSDRGAFADAHVQGNKNAPVDGRGIPMATKLAITAFSGSVTAILGRTGTPVVATMTELLNTEAALTFPRIVTMRSPAAIPFDARIEWTAGGGRAGDVITTGAGGTLQFFCVAKTIRVSAASWGHGGLSGPVQNDIVQVAIEDGLYGQTQDLHRIEMGFLLAPGAVQDFPVPPYARSVTVASGDPAARPNILVALRSANNALMAAFNASDGAVPVGAAETIRITNNDAVQLANFMLDFDLGYC
jgi:hypothetical protein